MFRLLCYSLFFFCWLTTLSYEIFYIPAPGDSRWIAKLKFLTIIDVVLQTFYYFVALSRAVVDYFAERAPSYYSYTKLHAFCDYLYSRLVFPVGFFVCMMFWSIYAIDRELIFPEFLDKVIPNWVNHMQHTAPVPFTLIESLLTCHKYPSRWEGIRSILAFGILYQISLIGWYVGEGDWAYPILSVLNKFERTLFLGGAALFLVILYMAGDFFNTIIWGVAAHLAPPPLPPPPKLTANYISDITDTMQRLRERTILVRQATRELQGIIKSAETRKSITTAVANECTKSRKIKSH